MMMIRMKRCLDLCVSLLLLLKTNDASGSRRGGSARRDATGAAASAQRHNYHSRKDSSASINAFLAEKSQRQLQEASVSEFCSNLEELDSFVTNKFNALLQGDIILLSDDEQYRCSCDLIEPNDDLKIKCGVFSKFEEEDFAAEFATVDYIILKLGDDGKYAANRAGWCDYFPPNGEESYCENIIYNSEGPSKIGSCYIDDNTTNCLYVCTVCPGEQSMSIMPSDDSCYIGIATCADEYQGPFLNEYHMKNPIFVQADEESAECGLLTKEEFCDDPSQVEFEISKLMRDLLGDYADDITDYTCSCKDADIANEFALECEATYSFDDGPIYVNTETMTFKEQNGHLIPSQMKWCEVDATDFVAPYCESFEFTSFQDGLAACNVDNGCDSRYCELCEDGLTYADTCNFNYTCAGEGILGSYLFLFKDTVLTTKTSSPACAPAQLPAAPTTNLPITPTKAPSSPGETSAVQIESNAVASSPVSMSFSSAIAFMTLVALT